jgi:isoleucyl-tRNA synthetase
LKIMVAPSEDKKCERCWVHDPTTGDDDRYPTICRRCLNALEEMRLIES